MDEAKYCKYCRMGDGAMVNIYEHPSGYPEVWVDFINGDLVIDYDDMPDGFEWTFDIPIECCPMCGRELKE